MHLVIIFLSCVHSLTVTAGWIDDIILQLSRKCTTNILQNILDNFQLLQKLQENLCNFCVTQPRIQTNAKTVDESYDFSLVCCTVSDSHHNRSDVHTNKHTDTHMTIFHYSIRGTPTHPHNRFTALLDFVRDYPCEQVPERQNQSGFTGARDSEWQWHLLGHMQICTSSQITTPTSHHTVFTGRMPFLLPEAE